LCLLGDTTSCCPLKVYSASYLPHAGFFPDLFFDPEYRGNMFLQNTGRLSTDYMALYPKRQNSSYPSFKVRRLMTAPRPSMVS
jgi:hypothetical protein